MKESPTWRADDDDTGAGLHAAATVGWAKSPIRPLPQVSGCVGARPAVAALLAHPCVVPHCNL
jgi:hypothetical protein